MKNKSRDARRLLEGSKAPQIPNVPAGLERLFKIDEIVRAGGPCRAKLYSDIKKGRLKAKKFGRSTRITGSAWRAYIDEAPDL
jgi:hypothetical protein